MRVSLCQPDGACGQRCGEAGDRKGGSCRELCDDVAACARSCLKVEEGSEGEGEGLPDRAQRLVVLVHARVGADLHHREADASRPIDLVPRRDHACATHGVEIRRLRGAGALGVLCIRIRRRSVLARCGLGLGNGGLHRVGGPPQFSLHRSSISAKFRTASNAAVAGLTRSETRFL
eukprot:CAMPEP_0180364896 /NCGR_PEP_ID=MMETSP0989-20121125/15038_1 /TAXON_ID=697907 /ORGANISM="non described non described, Strain CCMP2293" /LENGTH=175 /DNA_ID=CAMNT_0022357899 /DNA_START=259 /DNA_END=783 /DNA_ORIENTATION=-